VRLARPLLTFGTTNLPLMANLPRRIGTRGNRLPNVNPRLRPSGQVYWMRVTLMSAILRLLDTRTVTR
jgi:hypothetical protein